MTKSGMIAMAALLVAAKAGPRCYPTQGQAHQPSHRIA